MPDLSTTYLGMTLRNPIIVGSSGLTGSVDRIVDLEKQGAAAIVLKSIFEEDILLEFQDVLRQAGERGPDPDLLDYYDHQIRGENLDRYMDLIAGARRGVSIPVIASINCTYSHEWAFYARELQAAGADALELNMFFLPTDLSRSSQEQEQVYFDVIERVKREVSIPIALKISHYFTGLGAMIQRLSNTGVGGLVLFNRFYSLDFDIEEQKLVSTHVLSSPDEQTLPLRWVAIMAKRVHCDLAASTGIHDGTAVIKQIMAGAKAVQVVSALYRNGSAHIRTMLDEIDQWMTRHEIYGLEQVRGVMSQAESENPAAYERMQFLRYASGGRGA